MNDVAIDLGEELDFLDVIKELTSDPAPYLLSTLIQLKDSITNIAQYDTSGLTAVEKNRISRGYKTLREKNLVVRIKRGSYLINPRLSPPYAEYLHKVVLHWIQVTGQQA